MTVIGWDAFIGSVQRKNAPVALSIGVFDGVHRGHQALIGRVLEERSLEPWLLTFSRNPVLSLSPRRHAGDLMSLRHKLEAFAGMGIAGTIIVDFSRDFSRLKGAVFLSLIREHCALSCLVVGEDFHCGSEMDTGAEKAKILLEKDGVRVDIVPPIFYSGERISSTRIRNHVVAGSLAPAEAMLGRRYRLDLSAATVEGFRGRKRLDKEALTQVTPRSGSFPALFEGPGGIAKEGILDIDEKCISWHYDGAVEAITFVSIG